MIDPFRRGPFHTQRSDAMGQAAIRLFVALLAYPVHKATVAALLTVKAEV